MQSRHLGGSEPAILLARHCLLPLMQPHRVSGGCSSISAPRVGSSGSQLSSFKPLLSGTTAGMANRRASTGASTAFGCEHRSLGDSQRAVIVTDPARLLAGKPKLRGLGGSGPIVAVSSGTGAGRVIWSRARSVLDFTLCR